MKGALKKSFCPKHSTVFSSDSAENAYVCIWARFPVDVLRIHVSTCTLSSFTTPVLHPNLPHSLPLLVPFLLFFFLPTISFSEEPLPFWESFYNHFLWAACCCLPWMLRRHDLFCKQTRDVRVAQGLRSVTCAFDLIRSWWVRATYRKRKSNASD